MKLSFCPDACPCCAACRMKIFHVFFSCGVCCFFNRFSCFLYMVELVAGWNLDTVAKFQS